MSSSAEKEAQADTSAQEDKAAAKLFAYEYACEVVETLAATSPLQDLENAFLAGIAWQRSRLPAEAPHSISPELPKTQSSENGVSSAEAPSDARKRALSEAMHAVACTPKHALSDHDAHMRAMDAISELMRSEDAPKSIPSEYAALLELEAACRDTKCEAPYLARDMALRKLDAIRKGTPS